MDIISRLDELGWTLPSPPSSLASYIPAKRTGNLIFVSGQLPTVSGNLTITGKLGKDISIEDGKHLAHIAVLNGIAAASTIISDLNEIESVVRLGFYIACVPDFEEHHVVANGGSETMEKIWGDRGRHSRFAIGVPSLPLDSPLEVEMILEMRF